ncbi:MAG: zinc ribbon domain-containing protein [Bacteroidetes bacterium]|nr:MAG: zinc ribbon domain-containing protein [Bacteroidota bacterium]GIV58604.1 MAG: hypothetical protein KatS3mg042_1517 [Rhodothermaceae bacterium]
MAEKQRECPSCALDVDAAAEVCPYCGYEFPVQKRGVTWAAVAMILLALGWIAIGC